ncbi:endoplasmic reticulum protein [Dendrothele bispora CBS 962.96]|uniref:Glucosidase 2 subunit beta n=1 Tax=Dendrothele bispora (strain CBS 962.96) TaxID=1314807 RepID=A0A4S8MDF7_DENBC|nr:endoplasmic reticulum protein [Dendrothele bispora CBS 962.96]
MLSPWLILSLLPLSTLGALEKTRGVPPDLLQKYAPAKSGSWKCLDGSKEIPWDFVNDDSCDCLDGSDEPGTGACPDTYFYCKNEGHIGSLIPSSRVNDGLCEVQCCDGSDEPEGVCPNLCKEVGEMYRRKMAEELKLRKTGSKIRSSYITYAQKEKKRLEGVIENTATEIALREKEYARLKDIADRTESLSAAALAHKQQSPLYLSLLDHSGALKSLQREHQKLVEREKQLSNILDTLRTGYNPNYQDMAVLEAVRGWEYIAGLPHINDVGKDNANDETVSDEEAGIVEDVQEEELEEGMWTKEELEKELGDLLSTDYVSLLMEHDEHVSSPPEESMIFDIASYLPESFLPQYEDFKDTLVSWLAAFGIIKGEEGASADASRARQALQDAENVLNKAKRDRENAEKDLEKLFDPKMFGAEGEWKKLDGTCLEYPSGDYVYELCFFGESKQKPTKGGQTFTLGRFSSWNSSPDVQVGSPEYYSKQLYNRGTKCWNGPERSVQLVMTCGTENAITSVQELEKCEYQFTATTPALCLPVDSNGNGKAGSREEL